jgi:hypothetical protein
VKVKGGEAPIAVSCPADAKGPCAGSLALGKLGTAKLSVQHGTTAVVMVKLTKQAKTLLAQAKKLKRLATATAKDGAGHAKTTSAQVTLKS